MEKARFTSITAPVITTAANNIPNINIAIIIAHTITTPGITTATRTAAMITTATTGSNGEGQRRDRGGTKEGQRRDRGGTEETQRRDRGGT